MLFHDLSGRVPIQALHIGIVVKAKGLLDSVELVSRKSLRLAVDLLQDFILGDEVLEVIAIEVDGLMRLVLKRSQLGCHNERREID